jgi:glycosyltransferase involved in cell wall biosynthesis
MPSFAAIVPNYNDGAHIGKALASLFDQTHAFDKIIIVDDGSTDDSVAVIEQLIAGRPNIQFIRHEKNQGVVGALNTGINHCNSDFLLMCSSNDTYNLHLVEWCDESLKKCPQASIIAGNALLSYTGTRPVKTIERLLSLTLHMKFYSPQEWVAEQRRAPIHFNGGATMLRTARVKQYGGLRPELQWHCDWFMYNLIAFEDGVVYVPEIFSVIMIEKNDSYSSNINIWEKEKPVIENMVKMLLSAYPQHAQLFRRAALLPAFHLGDPLILLNKNMSWFVTPLLLWRVAVYKLFYWLKYLLPRPFMMRVRAFMGV